jgi:dihydrofolate reductase
MRPVCYSAAMSLDGYIAGPNGEYDWIVMDPEIDFKELFAAYDTLLMGRKSWEAAKGHGGGGMPGMKSYVFSKTLSPSDCRGATLSSDPAATVRELKQQPGKAIWLFGGGGLFKSLLELGLVDRVQVGIVPCVLGNGIPFVEHPARLAKLKLKKHRVYAKTGTVLLDYEVVSTPAIQTRQRSKSQRPKSHGQRRSRRALGSGSG